jgi:hypothetical protein
LWFSGRRCQRGDVPMTNAGSAETDADRRNFCKVEKWSNSKRNG